MHSAVDMLSRAVLSRLLRPCARYSATERGTTANSAQITGSVCQSGSAVRRRRRSAIIVGDSAGGSIVPRDCRKVNRIPMWPALPAETVPPPKITGFMGGDRALSWLPRAGGGRKMALESQIRTNAAEPRVSEEAIRKAEAYVQGEEGVTNRLAGWAGIIVTTIAVAMSTFHLYAAYDIVPTQQLRYTHVAFVLLLSFLLFPAALRFRNRIRWWDVVAGLTCVGILIYAILAGDDFTDRATSPLPLDVVLGVIFIVLLLEASRRAIGPIVPLMAIAFIAYAMAGPYLPPPWTHRGYEIDRHTENALERNEKMADQ